MLQFSGILTIDFIPTVFIMPTFFLMTMFQTITETIEILIIGIAFLSVSKDPWLLQYQKVHFLIVYSHNGITLYSRIFSETMKPEHTVLLAGAFSALTSLIRESTKTTGVVNVILLEGKELRLIIRENFICVLLIEYSTQASKWAQNNFSLEFEKKYKKNLEDFNGEISNFDSADKITDNYFP